MPVARKLKFALQVCDFFHFLPTFRAVRTIPAHSTGRSMTGLARSINTIALSRRGAILAVFLLCLVALPVACGGGAAAEPPPTPTLSPELAAGRAVFVAHCGACHSIDPDAIIVGPSLSGIAARGGDRVDGLDARAYVYSSIMRPSDFLVPGFDDLMPQDLARKLTGEEMDSVVMYVLSLN